MHCYYIPTADTVQCAVQNEFEEIHIIYVEILKHKGRYKMEANNSIVGWWHCPLSA